VTFTSDNLTVSEIASETPPGIQKEFAPDSLV